MKGQEFIIKFNQEYAWLTTEIAMSLTQVNLPPIAKCFKSPAYWKFRVLNHNAAEKKLFCEVITYRTGEFDFPYHQVQFADALNQIESVTFRTIDTAALLRTLSGGDTPLTIKPIREKPLYRENILHEPSSGLLDIGERIFMPPQAVIGTVKSEPVIKKFKETISVPLREMNFKPGCVSFCKMITGVSSPIEFTIVNNDIREEYDAIKEYFSNVIGSSKIAVDIEVELTDGEPTKASAIAEDLSKINNSFIENVKIDYVKNLSRKKLPHNLNRAIFTMDELFDTMSGEQVKANTFYKNENELLEDLLQITNTKHYKHLRFLSARHVHAIMKLRFITQPFSFIFLIEGDKQYHIVWETLDTEEATYTWHVAKDLPQLKSAVKKIETVINLIQQEGKTAYIRSSEDNYNRIFHDYSPLIDGFENWKGEFEKIAT